MPKVCNTCGSPLVYYSHINPDEAICLKCDEGLTDQELVMQY